MKHGWGLKRRLPFLALAATVAVFSFAKSAACRPITPTDQAAISDLDQAIFSEMLDQLSYLTSVFDADASSLQCLGQVNDFTANGLAVRELMPLVRLSAVVRDPQSLQAVTTELLRVVDTKLTVINRLRPTIAPTSATCGKDPKFRYAAARANVLTDRAIKVLITVRDHLAE